MSSQNQNIKSKKVKNKDNELKKRKLFSLESSGDQNQQSKKIKNNNESKKLFSEQKINSDKLINNEKEQKKKKKKKKKTKKSGNSNLNESSGFSNNNTIKIKTSKVFDKTEITKLVKSSFQQSESIEQEHLEVITTPFQCCILKNFFQSCDDLKQILNELNSVELHPKSNDMFKFNLSIDLKNVESPYIKALHETLRTSVKETLQAMTGLELSNEISMSFSKYEYSDVLLCHNDQLEQRKIAYILYLVPNWTKEDGGLLDMFSTDEPFKPCKIARSIVPKFNNFLFFEVTKDSFHQVSEILTKDKSRLSINGWFLSDSVNEDDKVTYCPNPWTFRPPGGVDEEIVYSWINPQYLAPEIQKDIRSEFGDSSEISLDEFLVTSKYEELAGLLKKSSWKWIGPKNFRNYQVIDKENEVLKEFLQLMRSDAMFLIMSQLTGLKLHRMFKDDEDEGSSKKTQNQDLCSTVFHQVRNWNHGCYTMIRDDDCTSRGSYALDTQLYLNVPKKWKDDFGGNVSYIAKGENEELLTVNPKSNCLAIVYRDKETMKFTKYINCKSKNDIKGFKSFQEIYCEYREDPSLCDDDDDDDDDASSSSDSDVGNI